MERKPLGLAALETHTLCEKGELQPCALSLTPKVTHSVVWHEDGVFV
jgi:hypothetical protein